MRAAALQQTKLNAADLGAGALLEQLRQLHGQTAELRMTEAVRRAGLSLGNETAVGVMDALGNGDQHLAAVGLVDLVDVGIELLQIEVHLGEIDQIGACAERGGKRSGARQPSGVTAHDLHDSDLRIVINGSVLGDLHAARRDILRGAGKAGTVVRAVKIVVDGLGNAHHAAFVADLLAVFRDLVAGVHRVVAAVIEEIADVVLPEDLQNALVVRVVHIGILHLVAAGAELGGRGVQQQLQLRRVFLVHDIELVVQHALDAVRGAVDLRDALGVQTGADRAVSAGVDDGGGAAGLPDDAGALQNRFRCHNMILHKCI